MTATERPPKTPRRERVGWRRSGSGHTGSRHAEDEEYFGAEMTLFEHLDELRQRIVKSAIAIAVAFVVGFVLRDRIFDILIEPYCQLDPQLRAASSAFDPTRCQLAIFDVLGALFLRLKAAAAVAIVLAAPIVCYQIWAFVSPGLRRVERRYAVPFILLTFLLFAGGALFAYAIIPRGLQFLLSFAGPDVVSIMDANRYLDFLLKTTIGFGLAFEFPLAIAIFTLMDVVTASGLRRYRRHAIFGCFALAAVITPTQDPFTMSVMAVPLAVMYEGNILFARIVERSRRNQAAA